MSGQITDIYELKKLAVDYDVNDIRERYLKLYSPLIHDAMEFLGLSGRAMDSGIYPLTVDMKAAGPAFTIRRISTPERSPEVHNIRLGLIKSMSEGCIMLSDSQNNRNCGQFGEITATAMRAAGCQGAVIDGSTRDSNHLIRMNFPTFCRFRSPLEGLGRSMITEYMIPIYVNGADGQLLVYPGDFVFGDNDGVVIVPKDMTLKVLEQAEEWFYSEGNSRKAMADGMDPFEAYNKFGRF
ncbi:MAG: RraA family protein [Terrimicrobiaceae bacterium]